VCVCSGLLFYGWYFGFLGFLSFWFNNFFWFLGHQTMDKVQKYASTNRSTPNQIFYIRQNLEKKWEYNGTVHQLFVDFKKAYDSVKREVLYNILLEFGIYKKLVRLIKMCLNKTYSKVRVGKLLSDKFPIKSGQK
jgi:hypothetical protein